MEEVESELSPSTALEFANVVSSNSSKWANGVRVRTGSAGSALGLSGAAGRLLGGMGLGPFPSAHSDSPSEAFSNMWRGGRQSISMPVSPVSSKRASLERFGKSSSELELGGGLAPWEGDHPPEVGAKRKVPDDLELTLGNSSLRSLSESHPQ